MPYPFFEATPPGTAPGSPVKPGPVFVTSGGVMNDAIIGHDHTQPFCVGGFGLFGLVDVVSHVNHNDEFSS